MASVHPHVAKAEKYARDVVAGRVLAGKWVRLACQRHLSDRELAKAKDYPFIWRPEAGEKVCKFIEALPHTKGRWAAKSEKIALQPWQCFVLCVLFGWLRRDGKRRFRKALLLIPRKNGKSLLAAGIGLYMFCADGEFGAEVYSGATTEKQAWEVFGPAKLMAQRTSALQSHFGIDVNAQSLIRLKDASKFIPLIGKPGDGASPSCAIVDEYHEHATNEQVDTMETGMGARDQPLLLVVTTAGADMAGPCYAMLQDGRRVLDGLYEDNEFFCIEYGVDEDTDWTSEEALRMANPNFDVSVSGDFLRSRQKEAINSARKQGVFKTKHLNVWVGARDAFFNVERWQQCAAPGLVIEDFEGRRVIIGLDLASKRDIAAVELLVLPEKGETVYTRFGWYYLPEAAVEQQEHYQAWHRDGLLNVTDGDVTDYEAIRDDIIDLCSRFQVEKVAYDPHQATMLCSELMAQGVPMLEYRPTVLNFSEPMKMLDALIMGGNIRHDGCPVMTWQIGNVTARVDAKDNVYPRKEREENKIDNPVALISALGVAQVPAVVETSFWEVAR